MDCKGMVIAPSRACSSLNGARKAGSRVTIGDRKINDDGTEFADNYGMITGIQPSSGLGIERWWCFELARSM